ncbi:hypothetical protein ACIBF5_22155 [Micromonospora sp. NPDC050417]|uniref:hypothetical protein n=1 Tax=Micromonospora sp. NPDC050417 TaxID=3364280 RepID=UPI00378CD990
MPETLTARQERFRRVPGIARTSSDLRLNHIEMVDQTTRDTIMELSRRPLRAFPDDTLPVLFEEQVTRMRQAPAVLSGSTWPSYDELNARANRLAPNCSPGASGRSNSWPWRCPDPST